MFELREINVGIVTCQCTLLEQISIIQNRDFNETETLKGSNTVCVEIRRYDNFPSQIVSMGSRKSVSQLRRDRAAILWISGRKRHALGWDWDPRTHWARLLSLDSYLAEGRI